MRTGRAFRPFACTSLPTGALLAALRTIEQLEPAAAAAAYMAILTLLALAGIAVLVASNDGGLRGR